MNRAQLPRYLGSYDVSSISTASFRLSAIPGRPRGSPRSRHTQPRRKAPERWRRSSTLAGVLGWYDARREMLTSSWRQSPLTSEIISFLAPVAT